MKKLIFLTTMIFTMFIAVNCKEKKAESTAYHGTLTFVRGDVQINGQKVMLGTQVNSEDKIEVQDKSTAVIQFENNAIITVEANSSLVVRNLLMKEDGKPTIDIAQNKGSTFNKIMPGKADYSIHTPTITAGVRGTSFTVDTKSKSTEVKLFRGKVAVQKPVEAEAAGEPVEETILEAGKKIEVTEGQELAEAEVVQMQPAEIETLSKLNKIAFVSDSNLEKIETSVDEPEKLEEIMQDIPVVVPTEIEEVIIEVEEEKKAEAPKEMTLDDLRNEYGKLSKVITKNGQTYIGVFKQVGTNIEIITTKGKKLLRASQVAKVTPY